MHKKVKKISVALSVSMLFALSACNTSSNSGSSTHNKSSLPDYDLMEDEIGVEIAGWLMYSDINETQIQYVKESGISVLQLANAGSVTYKVDFSSAISDSVKSDLNALNQNGIKTLLHVQGKDSNFIPRVSNVKNQDGVMGLVFDEPNKLQIDQISAKINDFNTNAGDKTLFVNLYPSIASSIKTDFDGDYTEYLKYYCDNVLTKLRVGEKWLSADRYPLTYDGKNEPCLDVGWLSDVEAVALTARNYEDVKTNFFIQTMAYGGESNSGAKVDSRDRVPTYEDVRLQEYTLMSFGYDMISCFCYGSPVAGFEFLDRQTAMIDRNGNKTPIYDVVKKSNQEILAFDHVIKQFGWQGVFTSDGGKVGNGNSRSSNTSFSNLSSRISLDTVDCLDSVSSTKDTLYGYFMDFDDNAGFTIVNYNETTFGYEDNVTMKFNSSYKYKHALCYVSGVKKILEIKNNELNIDLGVGEGVFVIPYAE